MTSPCVTFVFPSLVVEKEWNKALHVWLHRCVCVTSPLKTKSRLERDAPCLPTAEFVIICCVVLCCHTASGRWLFLHGHCSCGTWLRFTIKTEVKRDSLAERHFASFCFQSACLYIRVITVSPETEQREGPGRSIRLLSRTITLTGHVCVFYFD